MVTKVYLECHEGSSNKFYEISCEDTEVATRYGACGASGVSGTKSFSTFEEAMKFFNKTVAEKKKKGYVEVVRKTDSVPLSVAVKEKETTKSKAKGKTAPKNEPEEETPPATKAKGGKGKTAPKEEPEEVPVSSESKIYLECHEGTSNKFYEIVSHGTDVTTRYGVCGAAGVSATKSFDTLLEAKKFIDKTIAEKKKKGYAEAAGETVEAIEAKSEANPKKRGRGKVVEESENDPTEEVKTTKGRGKAAVAKDSKAGQAPANNNNKKAKQQPFFDTLLTTISGELQAEEEKRIQEGKDNDWTYDPRPKIETNYITLAHLLTHMKLLNTTLLEDMTKELKKQTTAEKRKVKVLTAFHQQVKEEVGCTGDEAEVFSDDQLYTISVFRFLEATLASNLLQFPSIAGQLTSATTAKQLGDALKGMSLPFGEILTTFPIPHAIKVDKKDLLPKQEDISQEGNKDDSSKENDNEDGDEDEEPEEETNWWDSFCNHMLWLFGKLDHIQGDCLGRIKAAAANYKVSSEEEMDLYPQTFFMTFVKSFSEQYAEEVDNDEGEEEKAKSGCGAVEFMKFLKKKYSLVKSCKSLSDDQLFHLAVYEICKHKIDYRAYFATLCYNVGETDYCGNKEDIVDYAYANWKGMISEEEVEGNLMKFIRDCLILGHLDTDFISTSIGTSSTYIPGMQQKNSFGDDDEDDEDNDNDDEQDEEDNE